MIRAANLGLLLVKDDAVTLVSETPGQPGPACNLVAGEMGNKMSIRTMIDTT
jgi:hypothetical protein